MTNENNEGLPAKGNKPRSSAPSASIAFGEFQVGDVAVPGTILFDPSAPPRLEPLHGKITLDPSRLPPEEFTKTIGTALAANRFSAKFEIEDDCELENERKMKRRRELHLKGHPADILAMGAATLMVLGGVAALVSLRMVATGSLSSEDGKQIVLGCVGGSAVSGVVAAVLRSKAKKKPVALKRNP